MLAPSLRLHKIRQRKPIPIGLNISLIVEKASEEPEPAVWYYCIRQGEEAFPLAIASRPSPGPLGFL